MAKTFKKIILDDLKSQGLHSIVKKIKSIKYETFSMGDSVDVKAVNLTKTERTKLESILREYQHGSFDGMTDCYNYEKSSKERSAKYVHLHHEFTEDVKNRVKEYLKSMYEVTNDQESQAKFRIWYDNLVWRKCNELEVI